MNVDAHDCEDATTRNATRCHGAPSVILRGVGAPNTTGFPLDGLSQPFRTATAHNSTGLPGAGGTQYVYMIRFERTLFDFGGVQYLLRQIFLLILSPFRLTAFFDGAGTNSGREAATVGSGCGCCRA